jgi:hypothetical protein
MDCIRNCASDPGRILGQKETTGLAPLVAVATPHPGILAIPYSTCQGGSEFQGGGAIEDGNVPEKDTGSDTCSGNGNVRNRLSTCGVVFSKFALPRRASHPVARSRYPCGLSTEPAAEAIRRRNEHRLSEQSCCWTYRGRRGHEEWRWPDRRSRRNTQFRQNRRDAS